MPSPWPGRGWSQPSRAPTSRGLLALGSLTDYGDGRVARATRVTRLGRDLEGLADACFFLAALHGAVAAGHLSPRAAGLERVRLAAGTAYASSAYFLTGHAPDPAVTRSGRCAAPIRSAALIAAGLGRRRWADRLLLTGTSVALARLISHPLRAQMASRSARSSPPGRADPR